MQFFKLVCDEKYAKIMAVAEMDQGAYWAMLVDHFDAEELHDAIWAAWHSACADVDPAEYKKLDVKSFVDHGDFPLNEPGQWQYAIATRAVEEIESLF
jgi:hypothetical protein